MSDTHAQTANVQADLARADVQHRKPNIPPGHVEAGHPAVGRLPTRSVGSVIGVAVLAVVVIAALVFLIA